MKHLAVLQVEFLKEAYFADVYNTFDTFIRGKMFYHPETRNRVQFYSLPKSMQRMIKDKWDKDRTEKVHANIAETARKML
jgi:hypothetical protein